MELPQARWSEPPDLQGEPELSDPFDPRRQRFSDCERYRLPWDTVDPRCLPEGMTGREVQEECDVPCIFQRDLIIPGAPEPTVSRLVVDDDDGEVLFPGDWDSLIRCAWSLLQANLGLIDFIVCTLSGDPGAGDCIKSKIRNEEPRIILDAGTTPEALAGVSPVATILTLGVGALVGPTTIRIFAHSPTHQIALEAWQSGEQLSKACACAYMASELLHEVAHLCVRDFADSVFEPESKILPRHCPFATMLAESFMWMTAQRYPDVGRSACCTRFLASEHWWSVDSTALSDACL